MKSCKTCKHLDVVPDKAGRRVVRKQNSYRCTVGIIVPLLPASVTQSYGFRWPPSRRSMQGCEGADCPKHEPIA